MDALTTALAGRRKQQAPAFVEDCFSTYVYDGTGAIQSIVNNMDLATDGGMIWAKFRIDPAALLTAGNNCIYDTDRGALNMLSSNLTDAELLETDTLTSINTDGFTLGADATNALNSLDSKYVSWTFKKQPRFFDQQLVTHTNGTATTVDLSSLNEVGMVEVKSTVAAGSWFVWHRSLTTGSLLYLEQAVAETVDATISVSGTTLTIDATAPSDTYIVYAHANDPLGESGDGSDGMIACGTYSGNGLSLGIEVDLGWEPQYIIVKRTNGTSDWITFDAIRGFNAPDVTSNIFYPNLTSAEGTWSLMGVTSQGFIPTDSHSYVNGLEDTYIYMAIRRPMKTPESGSEVFAIDTAGSTGDGLAPNFRSGFVVDAFLKVAKASVNDHNIGARLTGTNWIVAQSNAAEVSYANNLFDYMLGHYGYIYTDVTNLTYMFKRAKGFFDVVCYTGDGVAGMTNSHTLGVVPEMMWVKDRITANGWFVYVSVLGATYVLKLELSDASSLLTTAWNDTEPTDTVFSVGTSVEVNTVADTYIAYLFATLAGVSYVGSYLGDGTADSSKIIDCGFSAGARFVLVKSSDAIGDWIFFDTLRGIVVGTESYLELNTTNAEVTTEDAIAPANAGFIVNEVTGSNINTSGITYIVYSVA